jgi:hypothetical protein
LITGDAAELKQHAFQPLIYKLMYQYVNIQTMLNCIPASGADSKSEEIEQDSEYGNSSDDDDLNNKSETPKDVDAEDSSCTHCELLTSRFTHFE